RLTARCTWHANAKISVEPLKTFPGSTRARWPVDQPDRHLVMPLVYVSDSRTRGRRRVRSLPARSDSYVRVDEGYASGSRQSLRRSVLLRWNAPTANSQFLRDSRKVASTNSAKYQRFRECWDD